MKKIIRLTESQLTRVIKRIVEEVEGVETQSTSNCSTKDFKYSKIELTGTLVGVKALTLKTLIGTPGTKFKVMSVEGSPLLNGKVAKEGMIITPDTTIKICPSQHILISGMGYSEAELKWDNGLVFNPQYA